MKKILRFAALPLAAAVLRMIGRSIRARQEQEAARDKVAPTEMAEGDLTPR